MNQVRTGKSPLFWAALILAIAAIPVLACGGCLTISLFGLSTLVKSSEPYQSALKSAQENEQVIAELGEPIEPGFMFQGNINFNNGDGKADFNFPVSGPNGSGTLYVKAEKKGGSWRYEKMKFEPNDESISSVDLIPPKKTAPEEVAQ